MKSVLISIQPKWVEKIANGEKTIEVRKTAPKIDTPFKCYIYCTKDKQSAFFTEQVFDGEKGKWAIPHLGNGKVVGEFVCDRVDEWECKNRLEILESFPICRASYMLFVDDLEKTCLTYDDLWDYGNGKPLYGWHISDLKIYDKPKELNEFCIPCKVSCENCKNPLYFECRCEEKGKKIVTRPPQSWQYVEE